MIYGVATNDADYIVRRCPFYIRWFKMLERCYSHRWQSRYPTYRGCKVCEEWLIFSNFKTWMETQDWQGKQLDKDILGDGKFYSPETCCFVPQWLNKLLNSHGQVTVKTGVSIKKGRFQVRVRENGRRKYLGAFPSAEEAQKAYTKARIQYAQNKIQDYPNEQVRDLFLKKIEEKFGNETNLINSCKLVQLQPLQLK